MHRGVSWECAEEQHYVNYFTKWQLHAIPCNTMQYAIPRNSNLNKIYSRCQAIDTNPLDIDCTDVKYHAFNSLKLGMAILQPCNPVNHPCAILGSRPSLRGSYKVGEGYKPGAGGATGGPRVCVCVHMGGCVI